MHTSGSPRKAQALRFTIFQHISSEKLHCNQILSTHLLGCIIGRLLLKLSLASPRAGGLHSLLTNRHNEVNRSQDSGFLKHIFYPIPKYCHLLLDHCENTNAFIRCQARHLNINHLITVRFPYEYWRSCQNMQKVQ
jgi:hypothetical protein